MSMKQVMPAKAVMLLCTAMLGLSLTVSAADKDKESAGHESRGHTDDDGVQIIIRSDSEKKHRQRQDNGNQASNNRPANDNSNRQSDVDSERGLDRAKERRSEQADEHSQAGDHASDRDERPWYDPFGIFGEDKEKKEKADKPGEKGSWWWPF